MCPICQTAFFAVFIVFLLVRFTATCFLVARFAVAVACFLAAVVAFGVAATVVWADAADAPAPPRAAVSAIAVMRLRVRCMRIILWSPPFGGTKRGFASWLQTYERVGSLLGC